MKNTLQKELMDLENTLEEELISFQERRTF